MQLKFRWKRKEQFRGAAKLLLCLGAWLAPYSANAEDLTVQSKSETTMVAEIRRQAETIDATVGVSLIHLESGEQAGFNDETSFPLASTYKVAMAGTALSLVDQGKLSLQQMFDIPLSARVGSSIITHNLPHAGVSLSLYNIMDLMLRESDNTATDVLLEIVGGAPAVMAWLQEAGIGNLRVDRSTAQLLRQFAGLPEPEAGISWMEQVESLEGDPRLQTWFTGGEGVAYIEFAADPQDQGTPSAMSRLLDKLWRGELLSPDSTRVLQGIMLRCETGNERIRGRLPEGTPVAHKTGTVAGTVNDVGVITLPGDRGRLVISVLVKNGIGERADHERVIADIARTAYDYFVMKSSFQP